MTGSTGFTIYFILIVSQVCQIDAVPPISRSTNFTTEDYYSSFYDNPSKLTSHPRKLTKQEEALIRKVISHELENKTILNAVSNVLSAVRLNPNQKPN